MPVVTSRDAKDLVIFVADELTERLIDLLRVVRAGLDVEVGAQIQRRRILIDVHLMSKFVFLSKVPGRLPQKKERSYPWSPYHVTGKRICLSSTCDLS